MPLSLVRREHSHPLWCRASGEGGFWPLFARSAWAQAASVVESTTDEDASLASVRLVGEGSASHCGGGNVKLELCSGLCSIGRCGLSQPLFGGHDK
jgi:hypothetical protein